MSVIQMRGFVPADKVVSALASQVPQSGFTCELVCRKTRAVGRSEAHMLVFEKYYMRSENYATLSIFVTGDGDSCEVTAVGSGGSGNAFFKFSFGTEESFTGVAEDVLRNLGMSKIN